MKPEEKEEKSEEIVKKPKFDLFTPDPSVKPDFADASEIDLELEVSYSIYCLLFASILISFRLFCWKH